MFTLFKRKERLSLVLMGILLISAAAGLAAATAQSVQGTIDEDLAKHWRTDYDLLVRHPLAVSELEKTTESINGKFQSGTSFSLYDPQASHPGISLYQLKQIRSIEGVEVAAPLAVVGPATFSSHISLSLAYEALEPGIYREDISIPGHNGIEEITTTHTRYYAIEDIDSPINNLLFNHAGFSMQVDSEYESFLKQSFPATAFTLNLVAVDFEAEAAMHGLDQAMVVGALPPMGQSYKTDGSITLPMVLSSACLPQGIANIKITKLVDLEPNNETIELLANTKINLLEQSRKQLVRDVDLDLGTADLRLPPVGEKVAISHYTAPEALEFTYVEGDLSLIATGVGGTFGIQTNETDLNGVVHSDKYNQYFRKVLSVVENDGSIPLYGFRGTFHLTYAGQFDPAKLDIGPRDSPIAAPMEIYRQTPELILKGKNGASVPANTYGKSLHPYDFVGTPVGGLVPIEAIDDNTLKYISIDSIRVKVSGVEDMGEASQVRIAYIAQQIRDLTGLHVDIVLGSSKQKTPVTLYSYDSDERREYISTVNETLAGSLSTLEKETVLPVQLEFITEDDVIIDRWILHGAYGEGPGPGQVHFCL